MVPGGIAEPLRVQVQELQQSALETRCRSTCRRQTHGADHKVLFIRGQRWVVAGELKTALVAQRHLEGVEERNRAHQAFDFVKAIFSPAQHPKAEIDLRRSKEIHEERMKVE